MGHRTAARRTVRTQGERRLNQFAADESRAGRALVWKSAQLGGSKILHVAGTLLLGRLLTPDDFGLVAVATVAVAAVMAATDTGMTAALVQSTERRKEHYDVAWCIGLARGAVVAGVLVLLAPWLAQLFSEPRAIPFLQLMAVKPLLDALATPRIADLMRDLKFRTLALLGVATVAVELVVAISLASEYGGMAIVIGRLAGAVTAVALGYLVAPYRPAFNFQPSAARQLVSFGRWMFAIGIVAVAVDVLTQALVARRLGIAELGILSLATKLAIVPTQAGDAVASVAFPLYARLRTDAARINRTFQAHVIGTMMLLFPVTGVLIGVAGPLERHVLGNAWAGTAPVIALLALAFSFSLFLNAFAPLLKGLGRGFALFALELLQYAVLLAGLVILINPLGLMAVPAAWAICSAAGSAAALIYAVRRLGFQARALLPPFSCVFLVAAASGTLAHAVAAATGGALGAILGAVMGLCIALALTAGADRWLHTEFRQAVGTFFPSVVRISRL